MWDIIYNSQGVREARGYVDTKHFSFGVPEDYCFSVEVVSNFFTNNALNFRTPDKKNFLPHPDGTA